jgi:hypothetical protein
MRHGSSQRLITPLHGRHRAQKVTENRSYRRVGGYNSRVPTDNRVVAIDASDIPALKGVVEILMDDTQRAQWEPLLSRVRAGDLEPPARIDNGRDAATWLAWARANLHQASCMCHRCLAARRVLSGELDTR